MIGLTLSQWYKDIANAIRSKGVSGSFKPSEMADAIRSIGGDGEVVLNYDDSMGYSTNNDVTQNNLVNLLAYAFDNDKDLVIDVKVGSSTKSTDDVAFHFYWASEYFRCRFKHSTKQFKFQLGGGSSAWYSYVDTKEIKIRFNHSDNSIDIMQEGETTQHVDWPFSTDTRPLTNVSGSTTVYANEDWFKYLKMKIA